MVEIPAEDQVLTLLRQLPYKRRKEVLWSAFRGEAHPDPHVAALVVGWVRLIRRSFWIPQFSGTKAAVLMTLAAAMIVLLLSAGEAETATLVAASWGSLVIIWVAVYVVFSGRYARAEEANLEFLRKSGTADEP